MKVAFVNSTHRWGGVKTWCIDMASAMQAQGHQTCIVGRPGPFLEKAEALGLRARAVRFGPDLNPLLIAHFIRFFRKEQVDWVVLNVAKDMRSAGVAARLLRIPICQHIGADGDLVNSLKIRLTQRLMKPHLLTCSDFVAVELRRRIPSFAGEDITALHPGTTPADRPPEAVHDPMVFVTTSQLIQSKGLDDFLRALAILKSRKLPFKAILVGVGNAQDDLKKLARELEIEDRLQWAGFQTNVQLYLRKGDIFVLPSYREPLSIALEEAMAQGLIPVARRAGGVPEIWPSDLNSFLFKPDRGVEEMATIFERILTAPADQAYEWKLQAWEHAKRAFPLDKQCAKLLAWMEERS
ncbi:MAG: glycosyltransferase [Desulfocurvibacter africanus]